MRCRRLLPLLLVVMLAACGIFGDGPPKGQGKRITMKHPSGLLVQLPESEFRVEQTELGFRITPPDAAEVRSPFEVRVEVHEGHQPEGEWPQKRTIEGREVRYRVDVQEGGSAGQLHTLSAWESWGNRYVLVTQRVQSEPPATPDFGAAWLVVAGVAGR
jgi:hypothetical protein